MGLFDSIRHAFNPEVKSTFEYLRQNYYKGLQSYCSGSKVNFGGYTIDTRINMSNPSYEDMKRVYDAKDTIIKLHNSILESEKMEAAYKELDDLRRKYPHAFVSICQECLNGIIYDSTIKMPGFSQAESDSSSHPNIIRSIVLKKKYYNGQYNPVGCNVYGGYSTIVSPLNGFKYSSEPKCVRDLLYPDVVKVLAEKSRFSSVEQGILTSIKSEETDIEYRQKITNNSKRAKYVEPFLLSVRKSKSDKQYVITHLTDLDRFITQQLDIEYVKIRGRYPNGLKLFEQKVSSDKQRIIDNEQRISSLEQIAKEYSTLSQWEELQQEYTQFSRSIKPENFGCYVYDIPFETIDLSGNHKSAPYKVWQHFCESYYPGNDIELIPDYSYLATNAQKVICYIGKTLHFRESVLDIIFDYIIKVRAKFGGVTVIWGTSTLTDCFSFNDYHLAYLKNRLNEANISNIYPDNLNFPGISPYIVVIDVFTTNSWLKRYCESIIKEHKSLTPLISYISLSKAYDKNEVEDLISKKKQQIEEENRKQREINERKTKATEIICLYPDAISKFFPNLNRYSLSDSESISIINKEAEIKEYSLRKKRISNALSSWDSVKGIPYYFFWYYYPTRFSDVSTESKKARSLIYDFKDGIPTNPSIYSLVIEKLISTFQRSDLSNFTFVCIPASTRDVNKDRYSNFSKSVCDRTGMSNAFSHITITKEKTPAHLSASHHTEPAEYSFDANYFKNAQVILFDDVVTQGHSMQNFKHILEELGAEVICAISIGRTYSDYFGDNRKPHPFSGIL